MVLSDSILELILKSLASPESINEFEPMSNFQKEAHCQRSCLFIRLSSSAVNETRQEVCCMESKHCLFGGDITHK